MIELYKHSMAAKLYIYFKWGVYTLLFINMSIFFINQTVAEGMESFAWLMLLMLFEYETLKLNKFDISLFERYLIHGGRVTAYIFILYSVYTYASVQYISKNGILDILNALIWLLIVALIEYELYSPKKDRARLIFKVLLYSALFVIALFWGINEEWFDFYDAVVWIVCFFFIELNIIKFESQV